MGKFCVNCGKELEDGEVCNCQGEQTVEVQSSTEAEKPPVAAAQETFQEVKNAGAAAGAASSVYLKKLFDTILKIIKKPDAELSSFMAEGNVNIALGIIALEGILYGLYLLVLFQKVNKVISTLMGGIMGSIGSIFGGSDLSIGYKFPLGKIFVVSLILGVALNAILAGIVLLLHNLLLKQQVTYKNMLCTVSGKSVAMIVVTVVAIVVGFISPTYGLVCYAAGAILSYLYFYIAVKASVSNADKRVYIVFLSLVLMIVVSLIMYKLCYKLYLPEGITSSLGGLGGLY
ncbi:hypothetical protein [Anaerocolumna xylanovorans]|uniref:Yip1 domain-containing protein n=1 Tax=Anaerocolumna xylanovorans DSM 12503 TaxID=1121345 RepID=A0A1M7Y7S2_9FIRM|nr:hypothetical protein [Anaerocolumna xylanovorans]SHO48683.1 hypothetical protein SAMN02745217_01964 [Anaerocolumna xylanovorans DSM 12503]